jgi:hypothetical protein
MSSQENGKQLEFNSAYLNDYLAMVEDTESPRIFHIWSAIFAISASLGRRCWLPFGMFNLYPNMFVLLVGAPGTRKTTATNQSKRILKATTGVRFAPEDTGFQRQGLILALQGPEAQDAEFLNGTELAIDNNGLMSLTDLMSVTNEPDEETVQAFVDQADKHHVAIVASEFSRVIGQNNLAMMDFLGSRYDGEDYEYQTKQTHIKLKNTLMNMLACTTPVSIANSMPPQAGGQGFLSRIILVYGARKYKQVPWPMAPEVDLVGRVKDVIDNIYREMSGSFSLTEDARRYCESIYGYTIEITDSRFGYYQDRRYTHLLKMAMCIAASRGTMEIETIDCEEAHMILKATELGMPDALGEFGMNPLAQLKQEILETLRATHTPHSMEQVIAMFHRDARSNEIVEVLNDLTRTKQIVVQQSATGSRLVSAVFTRQNTEEAMMQTLREMMRT